MKIAKGFSINKILDTLITLKQEPDCETKIFRKMFISQSIVIIEFLVFNQFLVTLHRKNVISTQGLLRWFRPEKSKTEV